MNASATGRPLRWIMIVVAAWTGGRFLAETSWPTAAQTFVGDYHRSRAKFAIAPAIADRPAAFREAAESFVGVRPALTPPSFAIDDEAIGSAQSQPLDFALAPASGAPSPPLDTQSRTVAFAPSHASGTLSRWSLDTWLLWRQQGSEPVSLSRSGQLGGSQAGARLQYELSQVGAGRVAAYTRLTSALNQPAAPEAAAGLSYQPDRRIPVSVAVERRVALGRGARDAFAIYGAGGIGPTAIPLGLRAEGYAQGGIVGLRSRDAFADGKLSIYRPVLDSRLSAGFAVSGGAQPRLNRIDIAPEVQLRLSKKGAFTKIAAEWRERVAGNARPGSGLTVTVAAGF